MPHPDIAEALGISPPQAQPESGRGCPEAREQNPRTRRQGPPDPLAISEKDRPERNEEGRFAKGRTGHKTENVYRRYAIVSEADLDEAARRLS